MNKTELIAFEKDIEQIYATGAIRGPIHLRNGCEQALIDIFEREVARNDYVLSTWGSHLHALLHGIPADKVKDQILEGRSITLMFPEYRFYTSAIVGGIASIGVGIAWALKQCGSPDKVVVFLGDMAVQSGIANESIRYSLMHDLPILWVVEDNGKSVDTPTAKVWGQDCLEYVGRLYPMSNKIRYYSYELTYPHSGIGKFISF